MMDRDLAWVYSQLTLPADAPFTELYHKLNELLYQAREYKRALEALDRWVAYDKALNYPKGIER